MQSPQFNLFYPAIAGALFNHIASALGHPDAHRCNHTHSHAKAFCESRGVDPAPVLERLRDIGGYCDCEALMNSTPQIFGGA